MFTVALFEPQIPPNTGSIARLCGAAYVKLDIVGELGFDLSDKQMLRAGLDYWKYIDWEYHPDLNEYCETMVQKTNFHLFTTKASMPYTSRKFRKNDYLVFGSETTGISEDFLRSQWDRACTIPIMNKHIRSLNLATSVGIVLYEAIRQVNGK